MGDERDNGPDRPLAAPPSDAADRRTLAWIVAASLCLKLYLVWWVGDLPCIGDECTYSRLARSLVRGRGFLTHDGYLWAPGYIGFLAACRALFGSSLIAPRVIQTLISVAAVPAVYGIGARLYDRRAGLVAAAFFAFFPDLVAFTHYPRPETLYISLFLAGFYFLVRAAEPRARDLLTAGVFFGLATLVKGIGLYYALAAAGWLMVRPPLRPLPAARFRARAFSALLLACAMLLPILPWTVRNYLAYDRFLLVEATTGRNLYIGANFPTPANWDYGMGGRNRGVLERGGRPRCRLPNVVDNNRCETRAAIDFIRANPRLMLERVPLKLADLMNPTSYVIGNMRTPEYLQPFSRAEVQAVTLIVALSTMAATLFGMAGLFLTRPTRGRAWIVLVFAYYLTIIALTFGVSRFRLPLIPFLLVPAAAFLTRPLRSLREASLWRHAACALTIVLIVWLWSQRWQTVFDVFEG